MITELKKQSTVIDHGFKKSDKVKTELKNIQSDNGTKKQTKRPHN